MNKPTLILASGSPRRKYLLKELGFKFKVLKPNVDETQSKNESASAYVQRLSRDKAKAVFKKTANHSIIIAADTTVVTQNGNVLNKPKDIVDAARMIRLLQGRSHVVLTGVTVVEAQKTEIVKIKSFVVKTLVYFRKLTPEECRKYAETREGLDKAGAYAAQGKGMGIVSAIRGSYTNVVGLPLSQLVQVLEQDFSYGA
jgi:septum formation protein